jgi:hypothetical protein
MRLLRPDGLAMTGEAGPPRKGAGKMDLGNCYRGGGRKCCVLRVDFGESSCFSGGKRG